MDSGSEAGGLEEASLRAGEDAQDRKSSSSSRWIPDRAPFGRLSGMTSNSRTGLIYWASLSGLTGQSSGFDVNLRPIKFKAAGFPFTREWRSRPRGRRCRDIIRSENDSEDAKQLQDGFWFGCRDEEI